MMPEVCNHFLENIPAYALGALEGDEQLSLQKHLETCASCRAELDAYASVAEGLLLSTPPQMPPAALRARLATRVASVGGGAAISSGSSRVGESTRTASGSAPLPRARRAPGYFPAAFAFAAVLLVVFAAINFFELQALQRQQAQLSAQLAANQTALAMLAYPETKTLPFSNGGITGSLLLDPDRKAAALVAWDLPQLPANQTYQAWLIDPQGQRSSAGLFRPQTGVPFTAAAILSQVQLANFVAIGVTVEPLGGSEQPTGARVFKVDF